MSSHNNQLETLDDDARVKAADQILKGCQHLYSKGQFQPEKAEELIELLSFLADNDPLFLAHLTSYAIKKTDNKDLKVLVTYANFQNSADGNPFIPGGSVYKPNLRTVSQAAIQDRSFDAKNLLRLIEIARTKRKFGEKKTEGAHMPTSMYTAIRKYLRYRENYPKMIEGVRKTGLGQKYRRLYQLTRTAPSTEAASLLAWEQKDGRVIEKSNLYDFSGMTAMEIAQRIRAEKLKPLSVLGALKEKLSPVIAVAILEQCTPDQAIIYREMFESQGLLKNDEVKKYFAEKIKDAKSAIDRVDRINKNVDESVKKILSETRSANRKKELASDEKVASTKVFIHIDASSSMQASFGVAAEVASIIAETIPDAKNYMMWGSFNQNGKVLPLPKVLDKEHLMQSLFNERAYGSTDCLALWKQARDFGADVDIFITDYNHNEGSFEVVVSSLVGLYGKPNSLITIPLGSWSKNIQSQWQMIFSKHGIPMTNIEADTLKESALVAQTLKQAIKGKFAIVEEIMETPLLQLPSWWETVEATTKAKEESNDASLKKKTNKSKRKVKA